MTARLANPRPHPLQINWTAGMLDRLRVLRGAGVSIIECSVELGINHKSVARKCMKLALNGRMNRGGVSGMEVVARARRARSGKA